MKSEMLEFISSDESSHELRTTKVLRRVGSICLGTLLQSRCKPFRTLSSLSLNLSARYSLFPSLKPSYGLSKFYFAEVAIAIRKKIPLCARLKGSRPQTEELNGPARQPASCVSVRGYSRHNHRSYELLIAISTRMTRRFICSAPEIYFFSASVKPSGIDVTFGEL